MDRKPGGEFVFALKRGRHNQRQGCIARRSIAFGVEIAQWVCLFQEQSDKGVLVRKEAKARGGWMGRSSLWFRLPWLGRYFQWLEADAPKTDRWSDTRYWGENGESSIPGVYIAGDLTGISLLKFAAEGGSGLVHQIAQDTGFRKDQTARGAEVYDLVIVGAGIAGRGAGLEAKALGLRFFYFLEADKGLFDDP